MEVEVEAEILSSLAWLLGKVVFTQTWLGWPEWCEAAASSVVSSSLAAPCNLARMTTPALVSCSSFPALLVLLTGLLVSLLSVPPTEACKSRPSL